MNDTVTDEFQWLVTIDHILAGVVAHTERVALFTDRYDAVDYAGIMRDTIKDQEPQAASVAIRAVDMGSGTVAVQHHVQIVVPTTDPGLF